ncbi:MAG TPA: hypothetical protein VM529_11125 [Gemmata sp.]|nr:hypothetical protein [Gemmata sp.]
MGAFCVGIAFIAAATVLNIAHDRMSGFRFETLPLFIGTLYAASGKLGVTILLVSLGMMSLVLGLCLRKREPISVADALGHGPSVADSRPYFYTSQSSSDAGTRSSGRMVLETWKYVTPPNGKQAKSE